MIVLPFCRIHPDGEEQGSPKAAVSGITFLDAESAQITEADEDDESAADSTAPPGGAGAPPEPGDEELAETARRVVGEAIERALLLLKSKPCSETDLPKHLR